MGDRTRLARVLLSSGTHQVLINVYHWVVFYQSPWNPRYSGPSIHILPNHYSFSLSPENQPGCLQKFTYWTYVPGPWCEHEYISLSILCLYYLAQEPSLHTGDQSMKPVSLLMFAFLIAYLLSLMILWQRPHMRGNLTLIGKPLGEKLLRHLEPH